MQRAACKIPRSQEHPGRDDDARKEKEGLTKQSRASPKSAALWSRLKEVKQEQGF